MANIKRNDSGVPPKAAAATVERIATVEDGGADSVMGQGGGSVGGRIDLKSSREQDGLHSCNDVRVSADEVIVVVEPSSTSTYSTHACSTVASSVSRSCADEIGVGSRASEFGLTAFTPATEFRFTTSGSTKSGCGCGLDVTAAIRTSAFEALDDAINKHANPNQAERISESISSKKGESDSLVSCCFGRRAPESTNKQASKSEINKLNNETALSHQAVEVPKCQKHSEDDTTTIPQSQRDTPTDVKIGKTPVTSDSCKLFRKTKSSATFTLGGISYTIVAEPPRSGTVHSNHQNEKDSRILIPRTGSLTTLKQTPYSAADPVTNDGFPTESLTQSSAATATDATVKPLQDISRHYQQSVADDMNKTCLSVDGATAVGDAADAPHVCSLRLRYLLSQLLQRDDFDKANIISNIEYTIRVLDSTYAVETGLLSNEVELVDKNRKSQYSGESSDSSKEFEGKPVCSFPLLMALNNKHGFVNSAGKWHIGEQGQLAGFRPNVCHFKYNETWPISKLNECIARKKLRYIVVIGDSNGWRYGDAMSQHFSEHNYSCVPVKTAQLNYYVRISIPSSVLRCQNSDQCRGGTGSLVKCTRNTSNDNDNSLQTVYVEHLKMQFTLDGQLQTSRDCKFTEKSGICINSGSTQEFFFREYLQGEAVAGLSAPDLVLVFGSSHDRQRMSLKDFARNLRYTIALADDLLPSSTSIIWLSKPYENMRLKPKLWHSVQFLQGITVNEWLNKTNFLLFKELSTHYGSNNRNFPFIDLFAIGEPVADIIGLDGIHMKPSWYKHIVSYILQTFCNSDKYDIKLV